jgi:hypothetical protein
MKRHLFNLLAAVSLALCVATGVGWSRSHFSSYIIEFWPHAQREKTETEYVFSLSKSGVSVGKDDQDRYGARRWRFRRGPPNEEPAWSQAIFLSFAGITAEKSDPDWEAVTIPFWLIGIVTGIVPAIWVRYWRLGELRGRRLRGNLCLACGYDLRATPDRCPECGTENAAPKEI